MWDEVIHWNFCYRNQNNGFWWTWYTSPGKVVTVGQEELDQSNNVQFVWKIRQNMDVQKLTRVELPVGGLM